MKFINNITSYLDSRARLKKEILSIKYKIKEQEAIIKKAEMEIKRIGREPINPNTEENSSQYEGRPSLTSVAIFACILCAIAIIPFSYIGKNYGFNDAWIALPLLIFASQAFSKLSKDSYVENMINITSLVVYVLAVIIYLIFSTTALPCKGYFYNV